MTTMEYEAVNEMMSYQRDGYIVLRSFLDKDTISRMQLSVIELLQNRWECQFGLPHTWDECSEMGEVADFMMLELESYSAKHRGFIYDALPSLPQFYSTVCSTMLISKLKELLQTSGSLSICNLNARIDLPDISWVHNKPWHQDYPYQNPMYAPGSSLVIWMPIFDCKPEMGPVVVKKGSHRLGEVSNIKVARGPGMSPEWTVPASFLEDEAYLDVQPSLNAGDLLVFDMCTIHRSGTNISNSSIRWSFTARYSSTSSPLYLHKYAVQPDSSPPRALAKTAYVKEDEIDEHIS